MKRMAIALVGGAVLVLNGCASMSHAEKGALGGGAIGAGTGAIIGSALGHTAGGAVIGGGIGALTGGMIGRGTDRAERKAEAQAVAAAQPPLGLTDVVTMSQQHISDAVIIQQIRSTGSLYRLSPSDIAWLKENGVSDAVVLEMQATANRCPKRVYSPVPVYTQPVYVIEPPPPPVSVGFGLGYTHVGRCR
jgi:hypothetical protein